MVSPVTSPRSMRLFCLASSRVRPSFCLLSLDTCYAAFIVGLTDCASRKSVFEVNVRWEDGCLLAVMQKTTVAAWL